MMTKGKGAILRAGQEKKRFRKQEKELVRMVFLAPIVPAVVAAAEVALTCESSQMFVGGAVTAVIVLAQR